MLLGWLLILISQHILYVRLRVLMLLRTHLHNTGCPLLAIFYSIIKTYYISHQVCKPELNRQNIYKETFSFLKPTF